MRDKDSPDIEGLGNSFFTDIFKHYCPFKTNIALELDGSVVPSF